jgi:hypothetical protein
MSLSFSFPPTPIAVQKVGWLKPSGLIEVYVHEQGPTQFPRENEHKSIIYAFVASIFTSKELFSCNRTLLLIVKGYKLTL